MSLAYWRRYILLNIGIECESIEASETWGVGRIVKKLLQDLSHRPELQSEFRFFLYFKSGIPDLPYLDNPIFIKKIVLGHSHILENMRMNSFSLYYYICLPIKLWFEKLDLIFFPNYMLPIIFRGKSLVMLTEDIYHEINSGTLPFRYKLAYKVFGGWWAAKHATRIMAISETSKRELTRLFGISPRRIIINALGINPPQKLQTTNYKLQTTNYILYVGQAFPRRYLRETMLAFEQISTHFPGLRLIAIGKDKYNPPILEKLKNEINEHLGREGVIYKEYVPENELQQLYANAKLLIYVSSKEAFGLPPLEALGYGIPAVVADEPITHETFGNNAFFVANPYDVSSIAETIADGLANHQKREEIKNARESVLGKYTWKNFTDRFLDIARIK